jgi:hypothetical protein
MTSRLIFALALVIVGLTIIQPAASQQRLDRPPEWPGPDAVQVPMGGVPGGPGTAVLPIHPSAALERIEPANFQPSLPVAPPSSAPQRRDGTHDWPGPDTFQMPTGGVPRGPALPSLLIHPAAALGGVEPVRSQPPLPNTMNGPRSAPPQRVAGAQDRPGPDALQVPTIGVQGGAVPAILPIHPAAALDGHEQPNFHAPLPDTLADQRPVAPQATIAGQDCPAPALPCATSGGFIAGAEVTLLRPYAGDLSQLELTVPQVDLDLLAERASDQFGVAPRVWIGYTAASDVGVRVRYWQLDQHLIGESSDTSLDGNLPPGSHLARSGRLNMYTVDSEVTQHFQRNLVTVDVGVGVRAGGLARDRSLTFDIPNQADATLVFNRNFDGFGPTMVAEVRRQLGNSPFTFLVSPRGTMLFGRVRTELDIDHDINLVGSTTPAVSIFTRSDAELYTAELRMGVEWSRELRNGRELFAHVLWENQFWAGSGVGLSGVGLTGCTIGLGTKY